MTTYDELNFQPILTDDFKIIHNYIKLMQWRLKKHYLW